MNWMVYYTIENIDGVEHKQLRSAWRNTVEELNDVKDTIPSSQWIYVDGTLIEENIPAEYMEMSGQETIFQAFFNQLAGQYE